MVPLITWAFGGGSITSLQKWAMNYPDFKHLFECLMNKLPREELKHFLVQAWMIWNQRNAVVHGGQLKEPGWLNRKAEEFLDKYMKTQVTLMVTNTLAGSCVWRAMLGYKMNFDAAIFLDQQ